MDIVFHWDWLDVIYHKMLPNHMCITYWRTNISTLISLVHVQIIARSTWIFILSGEKLAQNKRNFWPEITYWYIKSRWSDRAESNRSKYEIWLKSWYVFWRLTRVCVCMWLDIMQVLFPYPFIQYLY